MVCVFLVTMFCQLWLQSVNFSYKIVKFGRKVSYLVTNVSTLVTKMSNLVTTCQVGYKFGYVGYLCQIWFQNKKKMSNMVSNLSNLVTKTVKFSYKKYKFWLPCINIFKKKVKFLQKFLFIIGIYRKFQIFMCKKQILIIKKNQFNKI